MKKASDGIKAHKLKPAVKSTVKKGTDYELFAKEIYEILLKNEGKNVQVRHNVQIGGPNGTSHQIDLYLEYEVAGVTNRLAIECKNYNSSISIDKIKVFESTLRDIGNNISGIFLCKKGVQSGAIKYAKDKGIHVVMLEEPSEVKLKSLKVHRNKYAGDDFIMPFTMQEITYFDPVLDMEWVKKKYILYGNFGPHNTDMVVFDKHGKEIFNIHKPFPTALPDNRKKETGLEHIYEFDDGYVNTIGLGPVKILAIRIKYNVVEHYPEFIVKKLNKAAKAILTYLSTGKVQIIDEDNNVDEDKLQ